MSRISSEIIGSKALILGYGKEGLETHKFLLKTFPNIQIGVADLKNPEIPLEMRNNTNIHFGPDYLNHCNGYSTVIHTPSIPCEAFAQQLGQAYVTSASNIFFSLAQGKTIAISGTKGKSTTTTLIHCLLGAETSSAYLAGNIGTPMLSLLEKDSSKHTYVIEMSSYQLADFHYSPHLAVLLDLVPEHLDYHRGIENYFNAKLNITKFQTESDYLIVSKQNAVYEKIQSLTKAKIVSFSLSPDQNSLAYLDQQKIYIRRQSKALELVKCSEIPLLGKANLNNVLAAVCVAVLEGITPELIVERLKKFKTLPHRLEYIAEINQRTFINDSLSTIPQSLAHALQALAPRVKTLIAGGYDRGLDFSALNNCRDLENIECFILFPTTGEKIWEIARTQAPNAKHFFVENMSQAVNLAYEHTPANSICLLSPAASSFNLFKDYADRGNQFRQAVKLLLAQG